VKYFLGILASLLVAVYALYSTAYYTWQTAVILPPNELRRAQLESYAWFGVFLAAVVVAAVLVFRYYRATMSLRDRLNRELQND
jgi:predicted membrane-bound mannosyltransferase